MRILIIDDNRDVADSMRLLLEIVGHDVRTAYSGLEGVRLASTWVPDVVASDIGLPDLDGYGVARQLRQNQELAGIKLIAVTAYGDPETAQRARVAGFDHILKKSEGPNALIELLA